MAIPRFVQHIFCRPSLAPPAKKPLTIIAKQQFGLSPKGIYTIQPSRLSVNECGNMENHVGMQKMKENNKIRA
jgi:hypothetical protein